MCTSWRSVSLSVLVAKVSSLQLEVMNQVEDHLRCDLARECCSQTVVFIQFKDDCYAGALNGKIMQRGIAGDLKSGTGSSESRPRNARRRSGPENGHNLFLVIHISQSLGKWDGSRVFYFPFSIKTCSTNAPFEIHSNLNPGKR